ncbi:MAG: hypothetical protein Q7T76_01560 [Ferruginibacter sp.]|nr:hypothetical protein [Ferruginibacter sp.]
MLMNHQRFFLSVLMLFLVFVGVGCKSDPTETSGEEVYYFPEKNTYYDTRTASYYYSLDSAKTWDSLEYSANDYGSVMGARIALKDQPVSPYLKNADHRKAYDGILLNVVNSRTGLLARADSIKKIKPVLVAKPKETIIAEEEAEVTEAKPQKGIKKFFNKLFGKKKDKKNE